VGNSYAIGVIRGDGIGPEVIEQGLRVLETTSAHYDFSLEPVEYPWNSQRYIDTGELMPDKELDEFRKLDAIYLGALGDPRVERGLVERSVIMSLRLGLDLYINLRPIVLMAAHLSPLKRARADDLDMVVVRENTEDAYVGVGGVLNRGTPREIAIAEMVYTWTGVERAIRYAFDLARVRDKARKVTLVDKSNAIRPQEIWRRVLEHVAAEFPDIRTDAIYVDAAAMFMVEAPQRFDVMVTSNLFGDILTDLGAVLQGGMGSAASGNIHPGRVSMFEPIHGSAPDIAGQNRASPVGAILAGAMMLDHLQEHRAARAIEQAVKHLLLDHRIPALDARSGLSTSAVADLIIDELAVAASTHA